jgi:hypothetical protein
MELKVELKPMVGQKNTKHFGVVDVPLDQYSIKVNKKQIGLVCAKPGSPINFLPVANNLPKSARDQIADVVKVELEKLHGAGERKTFDPPSQESVDEADRMAKRAAAGEDSLDDGEDENL